MYKIIVSIFLCCILIPDIWSQSNIRFNHLTVEEGLSQSSVTCIFQDRKGFMWFGTQDGLNRYDGYHFKVFKNIPSDSTSLSDNFILSIYEDKAGILYIETQGGNFQRYNPLTESFKIIPKKSVDLTGAKVSTVGSTLIETSGIVWNGGAGRGTGLDRLDSKSGEVIHYKHNPADLNSLGDDKVYSIYRDHLGKLWIGTFNGLDQLDEKTGKFNHFVNDPKDPKSLSDNWVWPIFEDSDGNLWIGTVRGGLNKFDRKNNTFTSYENDPNNPKTINDNFIFSIYQDRGGLIWVGTNSGGINYFNPSSQVFEHYKNNPKDKNSLSDNSVLSMLVDRNGIYWIGTRNGGLDKFDYDKKQFTHYPHNPSNINSPLSNSIVDLYEDRSGIIWLGMFSSGLSAFNPASGKFTHYVNNPSDPNSLTDNRVYSLLEDDEGIIWIGTYAGGLNKLNRKTGEFSSFKNVKNDANSISSNSVWSIVQDNSGNLWLGTFGGGVNVFNPERKTFQHFKNNPDDQNSLIDDNVIIEYKDSKSNIWIGTTKGLSRYDREKNAFRNYTEQNGLSNNFIFGIEEDDKGCLWLSTNKGLSRFDPVNETFKNYYIEDGLQDNEFNQNACARDSKRGNLLFGGINGFNVFNPDLLKGNTYVPPIVFSSYIRYNTDNKEGKPIIEKGISELGSLSLTYKDNIISFEFAALSYYNNFKNQYKYKLEGFNKNWIQLGNENRVTFTNLSHGNYKLKIIGSNNDGLWNENGASLDIHISPPWWKTNIAYTVYIIGIFSFLFGLRRVELNRREQKAQIRESELRVKATEAEKRALEIENDRKTKELEEARQLQLSMLPKELPVLPNLELAAFMRTATEVGGDYYDFMVQENGTLNIALGDATGHGLQAGTMVTLMKGFFTSDSTKFGLQDFMNHCSSIIKEIKLGRILMSFSFLKIENNKVAVTCAGMPPIYYYDSVSNEIEEILIQGMPLGAMRKFSYKIIERELKSGDIILLITDGLPEQMNSNEQMFDYSNVKKNFCELLNNKPGEIIEKLVLACDNWMNGVVQADDITILVIKVK